MSFTVRTEPDARVQTITCDGCSATERVLDERSRDQWKRAHRCTTRPPTERAS